MTHLKLACWLAAWVIAAGVWLTPFGQTLELKAFDLLTRTAPSPATKTRIVVVGIDEPSFGEIRRQWPWPRTIHAELVDALHRAGATVIAFDVVFAEPAPVVAEDAAFARALRDAGNVVLASDEVTVESIHAVQRVTVEPIAAFAEAAVAIGSAELPLDADGAVRRLPVDARPLWRAVADAARMRAPATTGADLVRFVAPDAAYRYVSYYQALDAAHSLPPDALDGALVLVGLAGGASPDAGAKRPDMFITPMMTTTGRLMPGVEVHAQILRTMLDGDALREAPWWLNAIAAAVAAAVSFLIIRRWAVLASTAAVAVALAALALLVAGAFVVGVWIPAIHVGAGLVLSYFGGAVASFAHEQALRRRINRAFAHYVSPHVVDELIAHPDRLRLGGERRLLTILFCDLAGFTTISERLEPEAVVAFLNRYFTGVTRAILATEGTVDKFLGDGLVAFWNAPLADADHARHACEAALGMQEAVATLRAELLANDQPPCYMRIGIHTGEVIVGNMGSDTRFDYTATGDSMNLASRLEGVNKVYGTGILVSETTVAALGRAFLCRPIDRVRVKGRSQPVDIFTLGASPELVAATDEAVAAYRKRDWDRALAVFSRIEQMAPDDSLARIYIPRIAALRDNPPPADWDAAVALTEK